MTPPRKPLQKPPSKPSQKPEHNPRRPQVFLPGDPALTPPPTPYANVEPGPAAGHSQQATTGPLPDYSANLPGRSADQSAGPSADKKAADEPVGSNEAAPSTTSAFPSSHEGLNAAGKRLRRFGWGSLFLSAVGALLSLAATTWAVRLITDLIQGNDWLSWLVIGLSGVAGFAFLMLAARELAGIMRLRKLQQFRLDVASALARRDVAAERKTVRRLKALYHGRADMSWALGRLREHEADIQDPGDLMLLADRILIEPLDQRAAQLITQTAKRISLVTAISPIALIDVGYVLVQNLSLLRQLATLYGARPGMIGSLRLARLVATHIVVTGGLALTDDLFGQVLGQDLVRRLSHRLGEGMFNGVLCGRIGVAAVEVLRPIPNLAGAGVRLRDLVPLIFRKTDQPDAPTDS